MTTIKWALWFGGNEEKGIEPSWMQDHDGVVFVFDDPEEAARVRQALGSDQETIEVKAAPAGKFPTRPFLEPEREGWLGE